MATRKKSTKAKAAVRRAGGKARTAIHHRPKLKNHAGVIGGVVGTVAKMAFDAPVGNKQGNWNAVTWIQNKALTPSKRIQYAGSAMISNACDIMTYTPLAVGLVVSASPKIPVVRIVAKPLDKMLRGATHGHTGL